MIDLEICKSNCVGCTHQGYLCRQYSWLTEIDSLKENTNYPYMNKQELEWLCLVKDLQIKELKKKLDKGVTND